MQYIFLLYSSQRPGPDSPETNDPEVMKSILAQYNGYNAKMGEAGVLVAGDALHDVGSATTLRQAGEQMMLTDGPFAETKEQLGGYYLVDCKDLDEALAWAKQCPILGHGGTVEVRPIQKFS